MDGLESDPGITLREAVQAPMNDPLLLVSAMATPRATWASASPPISATPILMFRAHVHAGPPDARTHRLEHRHRPPGQRRARPGPGTGRARRPLRHRRRFMEAVYKLWEGSWDDDAVRVDRDGASSPTRRDPRAAARGPYHYEGAHLSNPRRSARRCCIRPAPPAGASASPPRTPNACS